MNWKVLKEKILDTDLYTRSGTEVGVSEKTLKLVEKDGDYFTEKITDNDIPEICLKASSDLGINYPKLNELIFGKIPENWLVGNYKKIFVGHLSDKGIRRNGASAGIISGIQLYLLNKEITDGAITLRMRKDKPYLTEPIIASTPREIMESAQSKYATSPVNHILSQLPSSHKSLSYTGLPEQIASIRKLQIFNHESVKQIKYILGIFYGESYGFSAIKSVLRSHGVKGVDQIKSLAYREGEWPGHMRMELKNGKTISIPKLHANYLIPSHITPYSLYQVDYTSELADVSVGDAWAPSYEQRGEGWSVVIARTEKGLNLMEQMVSEGFLKLKEISTEELIEMHSHGLDLKKRGAFIRINTRKARGLPVPEYGYEPVNIPVGRKRFETLLSVMFKVFQSRLTIWILEHLPISFIGWFFIKARNFWKKSTKSTKKGGLHNLEFRIVPTKNIEF